MEQPGVAHAAKASNAAKEVTKTDEMVAPQRCRISVDAGTLAARLAEIGPSAAHQPRARSVETSIRESDNGAGPSLPPAFAGGYCTSTLDPIEECDGAEVPGSMAAVPRSRRGSMDRTNEKLAFAEQLDQIRESLIAREAWEESTTATLHELMIQINEVAHTVSGAAWSQSRWL
jgi:hypothetical protein